MVTQIMSHSTKPQKKDQIMKGCGLKLEPDKKVKVTVSRSKCQALPQGSAFYLRGPIIDNPASAPICATALTGVYPWIMAARFGIESKNLGWREGYKVLCPEGEVEFEVTTAWEE